MATWSAAWPANSWARSSASGASGSVSSVNVAQPTTRIGWLASEGIVLASGRQAVIAAFMGIYVAVTALSLPGGAVMALVAGGVFGLWVGMLAASFAT